eukprot:gene16063-22201_t
MLRVQALDYGPVKEELHWALDYEPVKEELHWALDYDPVKEDLHWVPTEGALASYTHQVWELDDGYLKHCVREQPRNATATLRMLRILRINARGKAYLGSAPSPFDICFILRSITRQHESNESLDRDRPMTAVGSAKRDWHVGNNVSLRTDFGEEATGTVLAFDRVTDILVLKETGAFNNVSNIRFIKAARISKVLKDFKPPNYVEEPLPQVDIEKCGRREERALKVAELEASRVGLGVTKEAQAVFDALHKTMPCTWMGKSILVLGEVLISEPYTPECAREDKPSQEMLARVKKVLAAERDRLGY